MSRVAITGIGIVSPLGRGKAATLDALRHARSGIRRIESIDATALSCRMGGEVPTSALEGAVKGYDRFTRLALVAAEEAVAQADFTAAGYAPERVGSLIGTGLGGCEALDAGFKRVYGEGQTRVAPTTIPWSMYNAAASALAAKYGARGIAYAVVSACASSAPALGQAFQAIRSGQADAMLAGGADAPLTFGTLRAWESMRVLGIDNADPAAACRPFSADRKRPALAEGAAVFLLGPLDAARRRDAPILGELTGFGITSDAGHVTDPSPDGAARAMAMALHDGSHDAGDVDYINAHGTATRANDPTETAA